MTAPTITILSAIQRTDGSFLVDVDFEVADVDLDALTINLTEFSLDGVVFSAATAQTFDRQHDAVSPLTGITAVPKTFRFVWSAFTDLAEGNFEDIDFKIEVTDGVTPVSDILNDVIVNTLVAITGDEIQQNRLNRRRLIDRQSKSFLGFGLLIPFERVSTDFRSGGGIELIRSRLRQLLGTRGITPTGGLGELPWRPDFGIALEQLRHIQNDELISELAFNLIAEPIARNEPIVTLHSIETEREGTTFKLRFVFGIIGTNVPGNAVFVQDNQFVIEVGL